MSIGDVITLVVALLVGGLFLTWFFLDRAYRRRFPPEREAAERRAFEQRILRPDWAFYEQHLQRPIPDTLRKLFADQALVTDGGFDYAKGAGISTFNPLDRDSLLDVRDEAGCEIIAFAVSDCGDPIHLRPGPTEPDTVYITSHDGGGTKVFEKSIDVMLEKLNRANHPASYEDSSGKG